MKYIYKSAMCCNCGTTHYYNIKSNNEIHCYICKYNTNIKFYKMIGNWDWA